MRFFFRSRQFKILISAVAIIVALSVIAGIIGGALTPQSGLIAAVTAPFEKMATEIGAAITRTVKSFENNEKAVLQNSELQQEINALREKLAGYDEMQRQNEFYKDYLEIKDKNNDFKFQAADIIARDVDDPFGGFVINQGSLAGISQYDPVITDEGLVGYVTDVALTTCKVATVLNPTLNAGAIDSRTGDSGVISGNVELAQNGLCRMNNLLRTSKVAVGDYIVTSGEGVFPSGLLIGEIETLGSDAYSTTLYAAVRPFADFENMRSVMVITAFSGQGSTAGKDTVSQND